MNELKINATVPEFNLIDTDGLYYNNNSFHDKEIMVVIFSCNHCPYVIAYEDRLISIQNKYKLNVQVIAINSNDSDNYEEDSFEKMKLRSEEKNFNFKYLWDDTQVIAKAFGATHTPEAFVFDRERKLKYHGRIDDNWKDETSVEKRYLENAIESIMKGEELIEPETFSIGCTIKWK